VTDLTLKITADASQAKAELRTIEQGIQRVETASNKAEPAIAKVTDAVGGQGRELSKVEQAFVKAEASAAVMERSMAKLTGTSTQTTSALSGMTAGSGNLSAALLNMVGAGELSVGALSAITGAAGGALAAVVAFGTLLLTSSQYYLQHSKSAAGLRAEIDHLGDTWNAVQTIIGGSVVGGEESPMIAFLKLGEEWALRQAIQIAGLIQLWKQYTSLSMVTGLASLTDTGNVPDPAAVLGGAHPLGSYLAPGIGGMHDVRGAYGIDPMNLPSGQSAQALFDQDEAERKRASAEAARLAKQRADIERRRLAAIQSAFDSGPGYRLGLSGQIGTTIGAPTAPFDPSGMLRYQLGIHGGSLQEAVSVKDMLAGVTRAPSLGGRIAGSLGTDLGRVLEGFLVNQGSRSSAFGGAMGGSVFGEMMKGDSGKSISSALTGALGGKLGGAVGSFIPFGGQILGSLVGGLFGKLFGETQGHKDLMAGNAQIADMKTGLSQQFGSAGAAQSAGAMFGVDLKGAWSSQNLAGAEHFKDLLGELAQKQASFNNDLGGTLGKIQALGGGIPEALKPYLQSLKDGKVLTQDNIDLIAKMADGGKVDFDQMEQAAKKYGISIDALGQDFKDHKMHQGWQEIIDDLDLLQRGGADMNAVLGTEGMQKHISELVQQSIHFGTTIPNNMKPFIERLSLSGQLLDENGNKITDISGLTFGGDMQTSLDTLNQTLKDLIEALGVKLPGAIAKVPRNVDIDVTTHHHATHDPDGDPGSDPGFHSGGLIMHRGGQVMHRGGLAGDEVPIIAQRGEFMLRRSAVQRIGLGNLRALNDGGSIGGLQVHVTFTQPVMANDYASLASFGEFVAKAIEHGYSSRGNALPTT
jgi:hypothetical protein